MKKRHESRKDPIARGLGATSIVELPKPSHHGPLGWLELRARVEAGFRSSGGRPSNPRWDLKRSIPFARADWEALDNAARRLSREGKSVGPGQLAALLIERALADLGEPDDSDSSGLAESMAIYGRGPSTGETHAKLPAEMQLSRRRLLEDSLSSIPPRKAA